MLNVPATVSIFLYTEPTDMRKGFDGLSGIVRGEFGADPLDGSLFLFVNRRRDRIKILHFDGSGYWLYYKLRSVWGQRGRGILLSQLIINRMISTPITRPKSVSTAWIKDQVGMS